METMQKWNDTSRTGNATQSKKVNDLIKAMRRQETRGIGQESHADRAFTVEEYSQVLDLVDDQRLQAMMIYNST